MYLCGPTVYNYVHIGNAAGRWCSACWPRCCGGATRGCVYARNITDVDDKINAAARRAQGVPIEVITDRFAAAYREDMAALGVTANSPDLEPPPPRTSPRSSR
jgi:cysteinyl-tRNA synthetase